MRHVNIYTESTFKGVGRSSGAVIYILEFKTETRCATLTKMRYFPHMTPNEAELRCVIEALRHMKEKCEITIYTESAYVAAGYNSGWIANWKQNGWKNSKGADISHMVLWKELDRLLGEHEFAFELGKLHEYRSWMINEVIKKVKESEDVKSKENIHKRSHNRY